MSKLQMLQKALEQAEKLVKDKEFADNYGKREQDFFKAYVVELYGDIEEELQNEAT